ncbi:MAG: ATP-binding protein [Spirochaetales bacterium]|nr:MAG: ATP-binding protein [Spirochaetales bacterium]
MSNVKKILQDDSHPLLVKNDMFSKEFPSDFRQIRFFTLMIVQKAPPEIKEINLLEQQVSEIIKNAVKHGNHSDPNKKIRVWWTFTTEEARLVVEDEGEGFQRIDEWNQFNVERQKCLQKEDYIKLADYVSYRTENSDENDGGNAMFAAVEYWNKGVVFSSKGNVVGVGKKFPCKRPGIKIS